MNINEKIIGFGAPIGRLLISGLFFMSGIHKSTNYQDSVAWMESQGVAGFFLFLVIPLEILGGLAIIVGWQTKLMASFLAGFCIVSALIFHNNLSDQLQLIMFMKNIAIAGGFILLTVHGAGSYSLDTSSSKRDKI